MFGKNTKKTIQTSLKGSTCEMLVFFFSLRATTHKSENLKRSQVDGEKHYIHYAKTKLNNQAIPIETQIKANSPASIIIAQTFRDT